MTANLQPKTEPLDFGSTFDAAPAIALVATPVRRIYTVDEHHHSNGPAISHLVRAVSQAQALSFLARKRYEISIATADQVATLMTDGVKVQDATTQD